MRDARTGTTPSRRVKVRPRREAPLNHRQQQIVHNARELIQARPGSGRARRAARTLNSMGLNDHERGLMERSAQQHQEHLDRMGVFEQRRRGELASIARRMERAPSAFPIVARGLRHGFEQGTQQAHEISHHPVRDVQQVRRGFETGIEEAGHPREVIKTATGIDPRHPLAEGPAWLGANLAMALPVIRGPRALLEATRAARAGEGAVDVLRAGRAAAGGRTAVDREAAKFRRTPAGKQASADLKAHPIRSEVHRQIEEHPDLTKREKRNLKKHFDNEVHDAVRQSGKTVEELFRDPGVQKAAATLTPQEAASAEVMKGLEKGRAGGLEREQAAVYSRVRGERITAARVEMGKVEGLSAKVEAAKAHLAGELPKLQFNGLRGLSEDTVNGPLVDIVENHPGLDDFEKFKVLDALRNAWLDGTVPRKHELRLLRKTFGAKTAHEMVARRHLSKYEKVLDVGNVPRALMSSFDVSAPFRQGLIAMTSNPVLTARNFGPMLKYFGSEEGFKTAMADIEGRANAELYHEAELAITDVEHSLENREDYFNSTVAEWFPKHLGGSAQSPVRRSGRAYTGFLVKTRADLFDHFLEHAESIGYDIEAMSKPERQKFLTDLGKLVNGMTGRGSLGSWEKSAQNLATIFFSPRLMASRLEFLNPVSYAKLHPYVRQQKLKAAMKFAGTMGLFLYGSSKIAGVSVGIDPWNADFGKIKVGDTRFDITGGFAGYVRMLGVLGQSATHTEGADHEHKAWDTILRFGRGKLAPLPAFGVGAGTGTDYTGFQDFHITSEAGKMFIPFIAQDVWKVMGNDDSMGKILAALGASAIGVGVNTYKDRPTSKSQSRAEKEDDFTASYTKKFGRPLPAPVAQAQRTKEMYQAAEKRRKDELGVKTMTEEQRTYVKLSVLASVRPDLRPAIRNFRGLLDQSANDEAQNFIDSWAEENLQWRMLEQFHAMLKEANG